MTDEERDREIGRLLDHGASARRIAEQLGITKEAVKLADDRDMQRFDAEEPQRAIRTALHAREALRQEEAQPPTPRRERTVAALREVVKRTTAEAKRLNPGWEPPA
jgi:IS30 family transposase